MAARVRRRADTDMSLRPKRPIRVLHIIDSLGGGGAERWVWDIVRLSDPATFRHRIVTASPEDPSFVFASRLRAAGAYVGRGAGHDMLEAMPIAGRRLLWSMLASTGTARPNISGRGAVALEYARFRPDIIHGHVFHGIGLGAWVKAWSGRPLIYSPWCLPSQLRETDAAWVIDDIRRLHPLADAVVTEPDCKSELTQLGVPEDKLDMFAGQVDLDAVAAVAAHGAHRSEVRRQLGIPLDVPIALSVGRLTSAKGHGYAIEALPFVLAQVPSLHWVLLGEGEDRPVLEQAARRLGITGQVRMPGYVADPRPFYAAADIYLRTHLREGENSSSQEAMAFGLPVAAFETGCGSDRIRRVGHGRLAPSGDTRALAEAIVQILNLPDRGRAMGDAGRRHAGQFLGLRSGIDLFTRLYQQLPEHGATGAAQRRRQCDEPAAA